MCPRYHTGMYLSMRFYSIRSPDLHVCIFFFNDTATTEIYTLSLHDALPIFAPWQFVDNASPATGYNTGLVRSVVRSEEHTSELQSRQYLVCRLLLEKKKRNQGKRISPRENCLQKKRKVWYC